MQQPASRRQRVRGLSISVALLAATLASPVSVFAASAENRIQFPVLPFLSGGTVYTWTVPDGVTELRVDVFGARGGAACTTTGGLGGLARATISVAPGEVLQIRPGGAGADNCSLGEIGRGGSNGGGDSGAMTGNVWVAGGGGGGSDVRRYPYGLVDRIVTAGGGGGAAIFRHIVAQPNCCYAPGGSGGGVSGGFGRPGGGGLGGTQTSGGDGGLSTEDLKGMAGTFGSGGKGADASVDEGTAAGGGGGGGWYGGGGGGAGVASGGGGGGGSGHGPAGTQLISGVNNGPGNVILTYKVGSGAYGSTYSLQAFDGLSGLVGLNDQGRSFSAQLSFVSTDFRPARLDGYKPDDPCRTVASSYNVAIGVNLGDGGSLSSAIGQLASNRCKARVLVDSSGQLDSGPIPTIRSLEPTP